MDLVRNIKQNTLYFFTKMLRTVCTKKIKTMKRNVQDSFYTKADNLAALKYLEYFMCNNFYFMTGSIDDYVNHRPIPVGRIVRYYVNLALHVAYTLRWAVLIKHNDDHFLAASGEFFHNFFKIKTLASALLFVALLFLSMLTIPWYFELRHNVKYLDILYKIRTKNGHYRLSREYEKKLFINALLLASSFKNFYRKFWCPFMWLSMPCLAISGYIDHQDNFSLLIIMPLLINTTGLVLWLNNCISIVLYGNLLCFITLFFINYKFKEIQKLTMLKFGWINPASQFHELVITIKQLAEIYNIYMGFLYLLTPIVISYLVRISIDTDLGLFPRAFAAITCIQLTLVENFTMFMVSSLSQYNDKLSKHIYPKFCSREKKKIITMIKLEEFLARINKEYIGFRCLTLLKFKRVSFYQYLIGISSCYILINKLIKID